MNIKTRWQTELGNFSCIFQRALRYSPVFVVCLRTPTDFWNPRRPVSKCNAPTIGCINQSINLPRGGKTIRMRQHHSGVLDHSENLQDLSSQLFFSSFLCVAVDASSLCYSFTFLRSILPSFLSFLFVCGLTLHQRASQSCRLVCAQTPFQSDGSSMYYVLLVPLPTEKNNKQVPASTAPVHKVRASQTQIHKRISTAPKFEAVRLLGHTAF